MRIVDVKQRSDEWFAARLGIPTASELDSLVTPLGKVREGDGVQSYLSRKLAERWTEMPIEGGGSWSMEQGGFLEDEALPWYELRHNVDVTQVGLVLNDEGTFGASPDGLVMDGDRVRYGLEIKCPQPPNHVKWLLGGEVPKDYLLQCYGGMFVTGAPAWVFLSYHRKFPPLVVRLERDEKMMSAIGEAVSAFADRMREGWDRLLLAEGGAG